MPSEHLTVSYYNNMPCDPQVGDLWYDGEIAKLCTWTGTQWLPMEQKKRFKIGGYSSAVDRYSAFVVDYLWWGNHSSEVTAWLSECCHSWKIEGPCLLFDTEEELTLFAMRWHDGH